jgi:hypothetical protein
MQSAADPYQSQIKKASFTEAVLFELTRFNVFV